MYSNIPNMSQKISNYIARDSKSRKFYKLVWFNYSCPLISLLGYILKVLKIEITFYPN